MPSGRLVQGRQPSWIAARSTSRLDRTHLAGTWWCADRHHVLPDHLRQGGEQLIDAGLAPGADVADQTAAAGGGPHARVHHVVHEDEVACLLTVPVDRHGVVAHDLLGEGGDDATLPSGILPGAVHRAEGQGAELQGVQLAIGHQVVDHSLLGHAVGR